MRSINTFLLSALFLLVSSPAAKAGEKALYLFPEERKEEFLPEEEKFLNFDFPSWKKTRRKIEAGEFREKELREELPATSEEAAPGKEAGPAAEKPPEKIEIQLPGETQLQITGRKLIGLKYGTVIYRGNENERTVQGTPAGTAQGLDMEQQLQIKIDGKIGKKINVNIDYDDSQDDLNRRKISVFYKGDPGEVLQEARFGDVTLSLPGTEFVGYSGQAGTSKELFGLMFRANYKKLNLTFIGSQTKGISEVQRYTGKTSFKKPTIADTAYISLRYYALSLSTGNLPLEKGSEKIYLDNITATDNQGLTVPMTAGFGFFGSTASYSGDFNLLVPGVDYTLDYQKGIINFRRGIGSNHVIAVDYRDSTGTLLSSLFGRSQIIKDEQDNLTMELKNRYNMGDNKIIRDPLGEKFILKILDTEGKETDSQGAPYINKVPLEIDYDLGIIEFNDERPFETAFGHSDVYDKTYKGRGRRHFDIYMEYRTRILSWQLRPSLVRDSEKVVIDGQLMERDRDYLIDYYTGWITFLDENKITDISNIEITYEYFPFLGGQQNTLGGMRLEFNPVPNFFGGSTILYSFSPQAQRIPDIRETPTSVLILDANLRWNFGPYRFLPFKFQLEGEGARSEHNPNRWDKALIENMEGIKQKDSFPMDEKVWLPASIETPVRGNLFLSRHDIPKKDINPNFQGVNENFSVLAFNYSIPSNGEVAVVYPISRQGTDYSEKEYVEMWLWGEGKNEELILELGSVNEDSDADNFLDTEDINLNGTLDEDEDTGWSLNNPDGTVKETVGKDNGLLDSEDLDQDGRLDTESNLTGIFTTLYDELDSPHASVNWSGWKKIKIPLLITEAEKNNWRTVKHVRLRLRGVTGSGRILLTALGVVGNRWEKGKKSDGSFSPTEYFDAVAVNNEDDLNYSDLLAHPDYTDLYAGEIREDTREQALALKYSLLETTTAYTEIVMASTAKMDFTRHRKLNFFIYGDNTGVEIFLKFGSDANNYFEFSETVSWNSWRHFILPIEDLNYDDLPDSFQYKKGNPNLNNISYLQIGIRNKTGQPAEGEIWVNEIYVSDAKTKTGSALKGTASVDVPGWLTVTGGYRDIDHNFESLTFSSPQDRKEKSGGVSLKRFSFLPFSVNYSKQETVTPPENITQSQEPMAQYLSKLDEGKVITETKGANANLNIKYLPQVSGSYSISTTSSTLSGKYDTSESAQAGATYSFPRFFRYLLLPPSVQSGASLTRKKTEFNELLKQTDFEDHNLSWNFSFPWQFFSFINLNSNYKYEERKARKLILENDEDNLFLPQMRSAEGRSNLSMKFTNWFVPNLNYTAKITENFLVPAATSAWISEGVTLKDINRTAKGSFTLPLNIAQIAPWMTPLKSLSLRTTLDLEDGETYKSVSTGLYTLDKFFLRDNRLKLKTLSPENPEAALYLLSSRKTQKYDAGWSPLGFLKLRGVFMPLQTASLQAYFTRIDDHNEQGTVRDIQTLIWPDYRFNLSNLEKILFFTKNATLYTEYRKNTKLTLDIEEELSYLKKADLRFNLFTTYQMSLTTSRDKNAKYDLRSFLTTSRGNRDSYGLVLKFPPAPKWNLSLNLNTSLSKSYNAQDTLTAHENFYQVRTQLFSDFFTWDKPLHLPFSKKPIKMAQQMKLTCDLDTQFKRSKLNVVTTNFNLYKLDFSSDFNISRNFRWTLGGGLSYQDYIKKRANSYFAFQINTKLQIIF